jgi:SAM-dependent methyltransferase
VTRGGFAAEHFARLDSAADALFYEMPRLVKHIDEPACAALARHFERVLPAGGAILDLMSSYASHLPDGVAFGAVIGLGMNPAELAANPRLTAGVIHDLNRVPALPFADRRFDACLITVSVQYLIRPVEVLAEVARVLAPGAPCIVAFSNRMFPTKAVAIWRALGDGDHARLVAHYFAAAGGFDPASFDDLSPMPGRTDPLYAVTARRAPAGGAPA